MVTVLYGIVCRILPAYPILEEAATRLGRKIFTNFIAESHGIALRVEWTRCCLAWMYLILFAQVTPSPAYLSNTGGGRDSGEEKALQSEYSVMTRQPERDVLKVCEELGIGLVAFSPLSRALLTGYINERTRFNPQNDNRIGLPRYQPEAIIQNWKLIDILKEYGDYRGLTIAQVAVVWLLAQKPFIVPIPGTTKLSHLMENIVATRHHFDPDELNELTKKLSSVEIVGDRYAGISASRVNMK